MADPLDNTPTTTTTDAPAPDATPAPEPTPKTSIKDRLAAGEGYRDTNDDGSARD